jgi:ABC-2 type transport system permease protein
VRYWRPALGFLWAFLSPLSLVIVFYIVFSLILKVRISEAPFFLYLMSAVFPWTFFQDSVLSSAASLIDNKNLIKEARLPHYLFPLSIVLTNFIIFLPPLFITIAASLIVFKAAAAPLLFLPFILAVHLIITASLSIIAAILYVRCRDMKYILETAMLIIFYSTPVFYSISFVKSAFSELPFKIYTYNPFVGLVSLYRIAFFNGFYSQIKNDINMEHLFIIPVFFAAIVLVSAVFLYKKNKAKINDYLAY